MKEERTNMVASNQETNSSDLQLSYREKLKELYLECPLPVDELLTQLGLYTRSSVLVKYLVLDDLYKRIINIPGVIMEFGTRWGQNMVIFENLRAIYEPFNKTRVIIGFDTFSGYKSITDKDRDSSVFKEGFYSTSINYKEYLENLLAIHEGNNILGHLPNIHKVIEGDVVETVPQYFEDHPETIVAMSYFDMGLYKPTKDALEAIKPNIVPGSVILLDELTWNEAAGEAIAFKEVFGNKGYKIEKSHYTPMRAIVTIQ